MGQHEGVAQAVTAGLSGVAGHRRRQAYGSGCTSVAPPVSFWVEDYEGPLLPGELDRARDGGSALAIMLATSSSLVRTATITAPGRHLQPVAA